MSEETAGVNGPDGAGVVDEPVAPVDPHPEWSGRPAGDYRLHVTIDTGGTGPIIVLLHGINSDGTDWQPVVDRMPGYRCIALDMLGWGESPRPLDVKYSGDDHAEAIHATLADMEVRGPFLLAGYSLGGDVALRYAARYPAQIRRLFLLSAPFYLRPEDFGAAGFAYNFVEQVFLKRMWKFVRRLPSKQARLFDKLISPADRLGQLAQGVIRADDVERQWTIMSRNLTNTISAADFARDLPKIPVPVVFALGVRDPIVRPDQTPQLKRFKPDIEIRRIVGLTADHFMLLNLPETVAAEILRDEIEGLRVALHENSRTSTVVRGARAAREARARAAREWAEGRDGHGLEPIVFLHGLQSTARYWQPAARALALDGREAMTVDLIGFGGSPKPLSWRYSVDDHVDMVHRTITAAIGQRPVQLVGHDLGALIAIAYAARYPEGVMELTAVSPVIFLSESQRHCLAGHDFVGGEEAYAHAYGEVAKRMEDAMAYGVVAKTMGEAQQQRATPVLRSLEQVIGDQDVPAWLSGVCAPMRIIYGSRDSTMVPEFLEALARESSPTHGPVETVVVDAGHNPAFDAPAETLCAIEPEASDAAFAVVVSESAGFDWRAGASGLRDILASTDATLTIRGGLMLAAAIALALFTFVFHFPQRVFVLAFAGFVGVWGAQQIFGAVGLRNARRKWLSFAMIGVLGMGLSLFLMINQTASWSLLLLVIGFQATVTGLSNLYVASRVAKGARPRWLLYLEGALATLLALVVVFGPYHGATVVWFISVGYLSVEGTILLAYAARTRRILRREQLA